MLDNLFSPVYNMSETLQFSAFLIVILSALVLGALHALLYGFNNRSSKSFAVTLATLPAIVSVVILMVSGSIGAGVAVAGTFSLVRFRSAPGSAREITAVFTSMALGLACGMGYPALAFVFGLILALVDTGYAHSSFGEPHAGSLRKSLQITVPESLEYEGVFEDIFAEYRSPLPQWESGDFPRRAEHRFQRTVSIQDAYPRRYTGCLTIRKSLRVCSPPH